MARARPGELTFAPTGIGTGTHIGIEELNFAAGINATHMPPSPEDAITDVVGKAVRGENDYVMSPISAAGPYIRELGLVPLGVTTTERSALLTDVPTIDEAGAPGYDFPIWYGLLAPAATPQTIIDQLAADVTALLGRPALTERLGHEGAQPLAMTRQQFAAFVAAESQRAARVVARAATPPR
jgi:tripartite-type tricarboxylate transporter receptor subunit TctC